MKKDFKTNSYDRPMLGDIASDLWDKEINDPSQHTVGEQAGAMLKDYTDNLFQCIDAHKKIYPGDFFVVVLTKKEPLLNNVIRNFFIGRQSCPKPDYDQAVFHYHKKDDGLEYLWVIPDRNTCILFKEHPEVLDDSQRELVKMVNDFADGTLAKLERRLNGIPEPTN